jgi:1-acyl-sn-glycerol-3-phosphate acyltransferase
MIWHILRYLLSLSVPAFYRKIEIKHPERISSDIPTILSFNHPNAFTDPLGITFGIWPIRTWYMARGDVFKPGLTSLILENIGIVPIFRMRDGGKEGLLKNEESYQRVYRLLKKNKKVIVFSEGLCIQERRLRPIKKGVSRMIFSAMDILKNDKLTVIPVGLFYEKPSKFRSDWLFIIGEPIKLKSWYVEYLNEPTKTLYRFQQFLESEMKKLVIHVNNHQFDVMAEELENIYYPEFISKHKKSPSPFQRFLLTQKIAQALNNLNPDFPEVKECRKMISDFFKFCKKHKIRPWMADPFFYKNLKVSHYLLIFILLIFSPLKISLNLLFFIPEKISLILTSKIVKSKEFYSSFLIGIGTFIFLFYFLGISFILSYFFSNERYPIFIPSFLLMLILSAFYFKTYTPYKKLLSWFLRGRGEKIRQAKIMLSNCKKTWESLTNFKV